MRLKKLWIKNYKNLKNFEIIFELSDGLTMIIGNNGSGKSNILEAISGIFHDAYVKSNRVKIETHYELVYEMNDIKYKIIKNGNGRRYYREEESKNRETFISESSLPSNVIALYSGEEERLWRTYYETFYMKYIGKEKLKLTFINKYYWNIALLTILLSSNDTLKSFICNELKIDIGTVHIEFHFDKDLLKSEVKTLTDMFFNRVNPSHILKVEDTLVNLRRKIYQNLQINEEGTQTYEENGELDSTVFWNFTQGFMPKKNKVITDIKIKFNGLSTEQLSEGEKKLILVKAILEFLADEQALILMDEPDAHINEGRKSILYNMLREYTNRQIVLTTHSPSLVHIAPRDKQVVLETIDGFSKVMENEKLATLQLLTPHGITVVEQNIMFNSNRPLLLFEGKTDIMYIKHAISLLSQEYDEYNKIALDFLSFNGTGNAKFFIDELLPLVNKDKKIVMFFDRDVAGQTGAAAVCEIRKGHKDLETFKQYTKGNLTVDFLPYKESGESGDFLIEDYFNSKLTIEPIIKRIIPSNYHPIKNLPKLGERIKGELSKNFQSYSKEEYSGFKVLIDRIIVIVGQ